MYVSPRGVAGSGTTCMSVERLDCAFQQDDRVAFTWARREEKMAMHAFFKGQYTFRFLY